MPLRFLKKTSIIIMLIFCTSFSFAKKSSKTRTIIDQGGHSVVLPAKINRVVISSPWPLASVFCLTLGPDKIVGLDPAIISAAENSMLVKLFPNLSEIPSSFSKNGVLNTEELLKLKPDVILYSSGSMADYEACKKAGIPAVGFSLNVKDFNGIQTINSWVELLGQVMGENLSNSDYVKYGKEIEKLVSERISKIPQEKRPAELFIHLYDSNIFTVPGNSSWADYWITASGGKNAAWEYKGNGKVNAEQLADWNPELIFIDNFNSLVPEDLYENTAGNFDWKKINAVSKKKLYKVPLGMYRWYESCSDSPLMLLWMAKQNHPDAFADIDLDTYIKDFYQRFYKINLTEEELKKIYSSKKDAAIGIKQK